MKLLRSGLVTAETQRDQLLLRLQALQAATAVSTDPAMKEALAQDREAAAAAAEPPSGSSEAAGEAAAAAAVDAGAGAGGSAAPATGLSAEVGVVQSLRARVAELETELRQVRTIWHCVVTYGTRLQLFLKLSCVVLLVMHELDSGRRQCTRESRLLQPARVSCRCGPALVNSKLRPERRLRFLSQTYRFPRVLAAPVLNNRSAACSAWPQTPLCAA